MAKISLTPANKEAAKALMYDLLVMAGALPNPKRAAISNAALHAVTVSAAEVLCEELIERNFKNVDKALWNLDGWYFPKTIDGTTGNWKASAATIAKYMVYFAELLDLYWDDTIRTPYEVDNFKQTILGGLVYKYGRYISAIQDPKIRQSKTASTGAAKPVGAPPQNNYKQSGPQSGNVRDLKGTPGNKVQANTNLIYKIIGDNPASKNVPNAFIKPLSASGAVGNTNKIFISSGNGYTDCTCYFDDPNDAQAFLDQLVQNNRIPANVSNMRVVKAKADPNGYFLVGTEFGTCAVSAKTLNEALQEDLKNRVEGWKKAAEKYTDEELLTLHDWMRRD